MVIKHPGSFPNPDSDISVFNRIYRRYLPGLTGYARRFLDEAEADDVVQNIFLKIWHGKRFHLPEEELRNYLYRSVLNGCRDRIKHQRIADTYAAKKVSELKLEEIAYHESHLEMIDREERMKAVYAAIEHLPEKCREIFRESYLHDKKTADIAQEMSLSKRTVEAQLYKALKILRGLLG